MKQAEKARYFIDDALSSAFDQSAGYFNDALKLDYDFEDCATDITQDFIQEYIENNEQEAADEGISTIEIAGAIEASSEAISEEINAAIYEALEAARREFSERLSQCRNSLISEIMSHIGNDENGEN